MARLKILATWYIERRMRNTLFLAGLSVAACAHAPAGRPEPSVLEYLCGPARPTKGRVAVLANGVNDVFLEGGSSGPPDAFGLGVDGTYRWATLPGGTTLESCYSREHCYPGPVEIVTRANAASLGVTGDYALVDVVVNCDGQLASPFNALIQVRRLDGTPSWPTRLDEQVRALFLAQRARERDEAKEIYALVRQFHLSREARTWDMPFFTFNDPALRVVVRTRVTEQRYDNACGVQTDEQHPCRALSAIVGYELSTTWELTGKGEPTLIQKSAPFAFQKGFPAPP